MFNGEQVNDHVEQDDHTKNVVEDDATNTLIHESFNVRMDDDDDIDNENDDDFDDVHDIPLLDKAYEPGESVDLGNTFWQAHFGKKIKTHLGRGLVKPSTEVLSSPRSRFCSALDRGLRNTSVEG